MFATTPSLAGSYRRNGYLVLKGIFPREEVQVGLADIHGVFAAQLTELELPVRGFDSNEHLHSDFQSLLDADVTRYIAASRTSQSLASVQRLMLHSNLLAMLKQLGLRRIVIGIDPVTHIMAEKLEIPGGYHKQRAHQDWRFMQGSLSGVTVWVPYVDVPSTRFPLDFLPGSHLRGLVDSIQTECGFTVPDEVYDAKDFVRVPLEVGDAVLFSGFMIHRTAPKGEGVRVATSFRYEDAQEPQCVRRGYFSPFRKQLNRDPNFVPSQDELLQCWRGISER